MASFIFFLLLFGGFLLAALAGISFFFCSSLPPRRRILLGLLSLTPLISLLLLFNKLFVSGHQVLAFFPCLAGGVIFLIAINRGAPSAFTIAPLRALSAAAGILWAGGAAYLSSHSCFMGACA